MRGLFYYYYFFRFNFSNSLCCTKASPKISCTLRLTFFIAINLLFYLFSLRSFVKKTLSLRISRIAPFISFLFLCNNFSLPAFSLDTVLCFLPSYLYRIYESDIRVSIKRPFEISISFLIRYLNSISNINIAQVVVTGCLKSDVGNIKETNLKKIS